MPETVLDTLSSLAEFTGPIGAASVSPNKI